MTKDGKKAGTTGRVGGAKLAPAKERSFAPDRKGESSGGALASKDKKRSVAASRDGSNTRRARRGLAGHDACTDDLPTAPANSKEGVKLSTL